MKRTHVSFDVFDTCLIRRCGSPEKIWDLMADRLFEKDDTRGRMSFVGNRSLAEENAWLAGISNPSLDDIYNEMNVSQWGFSCDEIKQLEMNVEEQELFPNPHILEVLKKYRTEGMNISFISDMYLPSSFIKRILIKYGFCLEDEEVFVSAECNAVKLNGSLFDYVLKQTDTKARQWIHYGDHRQSDYFVPRFKGIKAIHVSDTGFSSEEKQWLDHARFYPHKHEIDLWTGLCRLTRIQNERSEAADMAMAFIASNYVPYVHWLFEESKKKKITKLYFLGRDGHVFYEIAKQLNADYPEIQIAYLKMSRKVIYSSISVEGSLLELNATIGYCNGLTVDQRLRQNGLEYEKLALETRRKYSKNMNLSGEKKRSFLNELLQNDLSYLVDSSRRNRNLLLKYLEQEGVFSSGNVAFVDLGWYGSCRCNLNYILEKTGHKSIDTFYWGAYDNLLYGEKKDGLFIFQKQFCIENKSLAFFNELMEHYASMNSDGSTIAYQETVDGVIPMEKPENKGISLWMQINETLVACAAKQSRQLNLPCYDEIFLCCGLQSLIRLYNKPTSKEISFFSKLETENYGKEQSFISRLSLRNTLALLVWGRPAGSSWAAASINKTFGVLSSFFERFYRFSSRTMFAMKLRVWWEKRK